ncbi:MAG: protein-export chaperone SecB [Leptospiraceae bacterium]|nr:protein-export chaperone SecB [Leptospiraceae bacterium]
MDKTKQPGIRLNGVILEKSYFKRLPEIPDGFRSEISFNLKPAFSEDKKVLNLFVGIQLNKEDDPIFADIVYIGIFSIEEGQENLPLEQFLNSGNALAILLPYIREEISSRMLKAGLPNYANIPIFNAVQLMKDINEAANISKKSKNKKSLE